MFISVFVAVAMVFFVVPSGLLAEEKLVIEVLERSECSHCEAERAFLSELEQRRDDVSVRYYDVLGEGKNLFDRVTAHEKLPRSTPITIVGGRIIQGFDAPETTGKRLEYFLEAGQNEKQIGFEEFLRVPKKAGMAEQVSGASCDDGTICPIPGVEPLIFRLPIVGTTIDVTDFSLPTFAFVLGFIDGFNPCAMWVLLTFVVILAQVKSRKRLFQIVGLFIVAEAVMYTLILNVWFTTWDFVGLDRIVTPLVGLLAVGGGLFFLYEWYTSLGTEMACRIVDAERRSKIIAKIKGLISSELTILSAIGIIGLAFSVNVIEFACSIGIPQTFTKVLEMNDLGWLASQGLMAVYVFAYMLDDFLVFGLALWGFEKLHLAEKYSKWSTLVGGLLMLFLGYLLIVSPEVLSGLK